MRTLKERRFAHTYRWLSILSLCLLLLQACGDENSFNTTNTDGSGAIGVNNAARFEGNILFVKGGNLFVLHGKDDTLTQLTQTRTASQPSISPDGKTIAFVVRKGGADYSDIATMPITGGKVTMLTDNSLHNRSTGAPFHYLFWAANPIWTPDGNNIIYLSDFFKGGITTPNGPNPTCYGLSQKDWILDMGIVQIPSNSRPAPGGQLDNPPILLAWPYCYAGGDQDLSLRPKVSNTQVLFTSFQYTGDNLDLVAQISLLVVPTNGGDSSIIQLSPADPKHVVLEPSFSPDGRYITYIRRENGQDNLYIMPVPATITGTPNQESYPLNGNGQSVYYINTSYYTQSQKLAEGIIGQPVWGANNTLFFMKFANGEFNLFMAKVKFSTPAASATPTPAAAPTVTLDGDPIQLTQGGIDGASRPVWFV